MCFCLISALILKSGALAFSQEGIITSRRRVIDRLKMLNSDKSLNDDAI